VNGDPWHRADSPETQPIEHKGWSPGSGNISSQKRYISFGIVIAIKMLSRLDL
jgi:hypothetical protein